MAPPPLAAARIRGPRRPKSVPGQRTLAEHQQPERSLRFLKAGMRRHIETTYGILGNIARREWWWEPDRDSCSPLT